MIRPWRSLAVVVMATGLVVVACGTDVAANDAEVGQCTDQDLTGSVGEIDSVDCAEPHVAEVFALFDLDGDEYPGTAEVQRLALEGCTGSRFEDYVGLPYAESEIFAGPLVPTEETWNEADDRTVICFAGSEDGSPTEGSVKGADR
jgi:hypothetical protein